MRRAAYHALAGFKAQVVDFPLIQDGIFEFCGEFSLVLAVRRGLG
jgi:hypothetical protein